jgi:hypothetical protein
VRHFVLLYFLDGTTLVVDLEWPVFPHSGNAYDYRSEFIAQVKRRITEYIDRKTPHKHGYASEFKRLETNDWIEFTDKSGKKHLIQANQILRVEFEIIPRDTED